MLQEGAYTMSAIVFVSRRFLIEAEMPGMHIPALAQQLHELGGSWPCEVEFPQGCYSYSGPDGQWRVRFLIPEDMEASFWEATQSFCKEAGLTLDRSGAVAVARSMAA
jgi:hypothetical protein